MQAPGERACARRVGRAAGRGELLDAVALSLRRPLALSPLCAARCAPFPRRACLARAPLRSDISDRKHPPPRREGGEAAESSARSPASPAGPFRLPTCSLALTRSARPRTRGTVHRESRLAFVSSPARSFTPAWTAVPLDVAQRRRAHGRGRSILLPPAPMEHADNFDEPARTPLAMPATQVRDDAAQGPLPRTLSSRKRAPACSALHAPALRCSSQRRSHRLRLGLHAVSRARALGSRSGPGVAPRPLQYSCHFALHLAPSRFAFLRRREECNMVRSTQRASSHIAVGAAVECCAEFDLATPFLTSASRPRSLSCAPYALTASIWSTTSCLYAMTIGRGTLAVALPR